ncbi:MAG: phosphate/phosphite/phosphonate ABC transporter substrate-binding protein [Nitrospirota bacterium]
MPVLIKLLILLSLFPLLMSGCKKSESPFQKEDEVAYEKELTIGLIPERNIFEQLEQYEPLADYIFRKTGIKVHLKVLARYGNIVDNFISQNLDGAFFGSFTYALAHAQLGVEPVARPEDLKGVSTYLGLIFVRKDSGIRNAADMKGKTFAFVDRATTAGYLLPLAYFRDNGIGDYRAFMKETYFAGTHEDVIYDVLNKKADIGAVKNTVYYEMAGKNARIEEELAILAKSPDVPQNGLALRKDIESEIRETLKETLLDMHNDDDGRNVLEKFGAKRFIETTDADYKSVYDYIKKVDMYFGPYNHRNGS